jgi:PmbA protein
MVNETRLLELAEAGVKKALEVGADQAEVFANAIRAVEVDLQKDDIHNAITREEATFGIRVFKGGAEGFATVNSAERIGEACGLAVEMARVSPPDPKNGLAEPAPVTALGELPDTEIAALDVGRLVDMASDLLSSVKARDTRVRVDSGGVSTMLAHRAIATSTGIRLSDAGAWASGYLFGMAVDGSDIGCFDHDGQTVRRYADLQSELDAAGERFVAKTLGALGAQKGESFRGSVVLSPEVVSSFVLGDLLSVLNGRAVRTGRSPFSERLQEKVFSEAVTLFDDARLPGAAASEAFDREGTPTARLPVVEAGVLRTFLYDVYEARAAGRAPTGHAQGGASARPSIGASNLILSEGSIPYAKLCAEPERAVLVTRLSGSSNAITGEFSGVVKGGFFLRRGDRVPVREVMIAGNLYQALKQVSGVSAETRWLSGSRRVPAIRLDDISVTAG